MWDTFFYVGCIGWSHSKRKHLALKRLEVLEWENTQGERMEEGLWEGVSGRYAINNM